MEPTAVTRTAVALLAGLLFTSCGEREVTVYFYLAEDYSFSNAERRAIRKIAETTAREVRQHLPTLSNELIIRVQAQVGSGIIPETGENGNVFPPHVVYWKVDPTHPGGVMSVVEAWLRACLVHEFHHLARGPSMDTPLDRAITEGMATAFERDVTGIRIPWSEYPPEVGEWVAELKSLARVDQKEWMSRKRRETRWAEKKMGTYLVDQAIQTSGASWSELVGMSTDQVLRLALRE